jgi:ABC-type transport system involved in multi-copper enzyme maturation permease subunit
MSALVKKEIRLLLPSFGAALLLAFSVWLVPQETSVPSLKVWVAILPFVLCPAMVLKMTLDSFGGEISSGTFSNLLSQPVPRSRVWWTKTILLAIAVTLVASAWWLSFFGWSRHDMTGRNLHELEVGILLFSVAVYSGGLWTVLLFRQVAAAFWFTLLVPGALAMITAYLTEKLTDGSTTGEEPMTIVLVLYSAAGFFWARRMFLRAQDVQWTGGTISLPSWLKLPQWVVPIRMPESRRPRLALLAKEFQLHQSQLVIAGALALMHLGMIVARKAGGGFKDSPVLEFVTFQFWILWPVMPLLIGCAAVAEERKLGTLEAQLCLPVRRRTQFVIKSGFALALAIFFGVFMPLLFEGSRILPDFHANMGDFLKFYGYTSPGILILTVIEVVNALNPWLPLLPLFIISVGLVAIAFYASTLVRNTLQAIAPAILGILLAWAMLVGADPGVIHHTLWRGPLIYFIGIPALAATIAGLTYWNFKRVLVGWPVWRRNLLILFSSLTLVVTATTAVYHRAWEYFVAEPAHGSSRLTQSQVVALQGELLDLTVQFADGRVWLTPFTTSASGWTAKLLGNWRIVEMFGGGHFMAGTNWMTLAHCRQDVIGLQKDGSLWVSEQPENPWKAWRRGQPRIPEAIKLVRFGNDSDWKCLAARWTEAYLVKNDGSLWRVGTNRFDRKKKKWPGLRAFEPERLGTNSDWAELSSGSQQWQIIFRKTDGRAWVNSGFYEDKENIQFDRDLSLGREPLYDGHEWRGLAWAGNRSSSSFQVGIRNDGTFRVCRRWQVARGKQLRTMELAKCDVQLGKDSDWLTLASVEEGSVVTLKANGSLWKWDFPVDPVKMPDTARAKRLGTYSDWIAIDEHNSDGIISLAADGSLWFWRFELHDHDSFAPLLAPSRKPQRIASILGKAD